VRISRDGTDPPLGTFKQSCHPQRYQALFGCHPFFPQQAGTFLYASLTPTVRLSRSHSMCLYEYN